MEILYKIKEISSKIFPYIQDKIILFYTFAILFVFPLYTHNAYYDITIYKYYFMTKVTIFFGIVYLVFYVLKLQRPTKELLAHWKWFDLLFLLFLLAGAISVRFSEYGQEAFSGAMGRRAGLYIYLIYAIAVIIIVSNAKFHSVCVYFLEFSACIAGGIGILNHYGLDPLYFFWDLVAEQQKFFSSTLGHIDIFGTLMGITYVLSGILFILEKKMWKTMIHGICCFISMCAIISNSADGPFLAVILFFVFGWIVVKTYLDLVRYIGIGITFFVSARVLGILDQSVSTVKEIDGIGAFLMQTQISVIGITFFLVFGIAAFIAWKTDLISEKAIKWIRRGLMGLIIIGAIGGISAFIYANCRPDHAKSNHILNELIIVDTWGNNRGYIWIKTVNYYKELPIFQKLFGTGPDTTYQIFQKICTESFLTDYDLYYDNAHNEYLQIILTHGLIGFICYFGWIWGSIIQAFKKGKEHYEFYAIGFAIIAYEVMAVVSINVINIMGVVIVLIALGKCADWSECKISLIGNTVDEEDKIKE